MGTEARSSEADLDVAVNFVDTQNSNQAMFTTTIYYIATTIHMQSNHLLEFQQL